MTVSVCIPHLPYRGDMLLEAMASITLQTQPPDEVMIASDVTREGASATRNRALRMASSEFVAFLDDDDWFLPNHLEFLHNYIVHDDADLAYSWFEVPNGFDPFRVDGVSPEGHVFDDRLRDCIINHESNFIPITVMARRELMMDLGGFPLPESDRWVSPDNEDWGMWKDMLNAGAKFVHVPVRTWVWNWHGKNTTGRSDR